MKKLETKLFLTSFLAIGLFIGFGSLSLLNARDQRLLSKEVNTSTQVLVSSHGLFKKKLKSEALKSLENLKGQLQPDFRQKAIAKLLKTTNRKNLLHVIDSETRFQKFTYSSISHLNERVITYGGFALIAASLIFLGILAWNRKLVFSPIFNLNRKMLDFLNLELL